VCAVDVSARRRSHRAVRVEDVADDRRRRSTLRRQVSPRPLVVVAAASAAVSPRRRHRLAASRLDRQQHLVQMGTHESFNLLLVYTKQLNVQ